MTPQLARFREALTARLGWAFDESKNEWLDEVLRRRLAAARTGPDDYLTALEQLAPPDELRALAHELTVGETYFFRHLEQFRALTATLAPREVHGTPRVRLLSVGCASGEEAYTLAIAMREWRGNSGWAFSIRAVDVNRGSLERAQKARYGAWALRDTPQELRDRWFVRDGAHLTVKDEIRAAVTFEERNIAAPDPDLWAGESYDAIFFRNVLMYFSPEVARTVIGRVVRALKPGGHLFLGHAENLRGLSSDFHLCHTHGTFYYQRKPATGAASSEPLPPPPLSSPSPAGSEEPANAWFDSIRQASERVHALTQASSADAAPRWDLAPVRRSLERERFDEAFELLGALPAESRADPEALLLWAVTQFQRGRLTEAEAACRALLERDELSAPAHYLLALCRDGSRDDAAAGEEDRVASYLDPAFALPRMHLGLLARRGGDLEAARRELTQAVWLLHREDPSRLMLFSGGFGRQALISVCESELARCGGPR